MRKLRGKCIADLMNGLEAIGIFIDEHDETMLSAYVRGDICERDVLAHVCQFRDLTSYQQWLQRELVPDAQTCRSPTSVEQVVHEISVQFRRKYAEGRSGDCPDYPPFQDIADLLKMLSLSALAELDSDSLECPVAH